jgi:hypothetical protein
LHAQILLFDNAPTASPLKVLGLDAGGEGQDPLEAGIGPTAPISPFSTLEDLAEAAAGDNDRLAP